MKKAILQGLKISIVLLTALTLKPAISKSSHDYHLKYKGYKVYDIFLEDNKQYNDFIDFFQNSIDVISSPRHLQPIRVLFSPLQLLKFEEFRKSNTNLKFRLVNENVSESIRIESENQWRSKRSLNNAIINFESYQSFEAINNYLEYLGAQYPKQVKLLELGKSYEGRPLKAILITNVTSTSNAKVSSVVKPLILIDAGVHAREWISHATSLYVIQQLVENSTFYHKELQMHDWLVWPVVNPDGYVYSHDFERLWRKTRQVYDDGSQCVGADLNRNFDFYWAYVGSSNDSCSEAYQGPKAFSEPEAVALRDLFSKVNSSCQMYLTLHSYGNYLLYPWGYDKKLPPTWRYLDVVAHAGANAIKHFSGTSYRVGSSTNVLYAASGASDDYAFGVANIPVVLCMELNSGGSAFDPPTDRILPIVMESWQGIRAMALEAYENPLRNVAGHGLSATLLQIWLIVFIVIRI